MNKWVCSSEQERNLKAYSMPHHGILYGVTKYFAHCIIFHDIVKYSLTSPRIFCHITSMVYLEMKNGLLTLKVIKNNIMWMFENILVNLTWCILSSLVQTMSKCLMFFDNNYNICSNVKMGGNCIFEKYLIKINFSKYIKYLTNMCWNGWNIIHK